MTADDRLKELGESLLLAEAAGAESVPLAVEDMRFLMERIEYLKTSRRV